MERVKIEEIEARLEKATPGPWAPGKSYAAVVAPAITQICYGDCDCDLTCTEAYGGKLIGESFGGADAELVAHAPTDLRELVEEVKRLRTELAKFKALARKDAQMIVAVIQGRAYAEKELAKFHLCEEGQCLLWKEGKFHPFKVYHKKCE